jgi:hypothetical protein
MIASSTKAGSPLTRSAVFLLGGLIWATSAAAAPIPLTPPPAADAPPSDAAPAEPLAAPEPPEPPAPTPNGVKVETLAKIDPDGFGVADERETKFTGPQWNGSSRALALALIEKLPNTFASPSLRLLQRRLLLAPSQLPSATGPDSPSSLGIRAAKLAAMGDGAAAQSLLQLMPDRLKGEASARASLDQLWISNQTEAACSGLDKQYATYRGAYWQQARVACQALAGQKNEAQIGSQALRDEGMDDPVFFALLDTQGIAKPPALPSGNWTPIDLALATVFNRDVPATAMAGADVRMAAALANNTSAAPALRVAAAERAAAAGALDADGLAQAYMAMEGTSAELSKFSTVVKAAPNNARARALVFKEARLEPSPIERANLIAAGLEAVRGTDLFAVTTRAYQSSITPLKPGPDMSKYTLEFGRALIVAGALDAARGWFDYARQLKGDEAGQLPRLWAYARLAGIKEAGTPDPTVLRAWLEAEMERDADGAPARRALLLALLGATGEALSGDAFLPLADTAAKSVPIVANPSSWIELRTATAGTRLGESVALALINSGGRPGGPGDVIVLDQVVASLHAFSLDIEARGYAVETAAASDL